MAFVTLAFDLGALAAEDAEAACFAAGALSVTLSDARDDAVLEPAPGEVRLWPATRVTALFTGETDATGAAQRLAHSLGMAAGSIVTAVLEDRLWEREWLKDFHARRCGRRLWICPRHESVSEPGALVLLLDPGLAFGTGTHPTTAMCLEWLDRELAPGARVIDYGCGSGILGLAAAKLGASHVWCFDIDPQALTATRDNAEANSLGERITLCADAAALPAASDVLLANILAGPLCELAGRMASLVRPGGRIVLAGIIEAQAADVTGAYATWFDMRRFAVREDWVGLEGLRRTSVSAPAPRA